MYATFGKKRTRLFPEDVDANKADEISPICGGRGSNRAGRIPREGRSRGMRLFFVGVGGGV